MIIIATDEINGKRSKVKRCLLVGLDFRTSAGQISRVNVKGHVATSNPRIGIFLVDEIDVQSESNPGCACYACAGLRAVAFLVPVRYSAQNSCDEKKERTH